jgi:hypothetical protein
VEAPPRMASQPFLDLRMLVGGVVVDDGVDRLQGLRMKICLGFA